MQLFVTVSEKTDHLAPVLDIEILVPRCSVLIVQIVQDMYMYIVHFLLYMHVYCGGVAGM